MTHPQPPIDELMAGSTWRPLLDKLVLVRSNGLIIGCVARLLDGSFTAERNGTSLGIFYTEAQAKEASERHSPSRLQLRKLP